MRERLCCVGWWSWKVWKVDFRREGGAMGYLGKNIPGRGHSVPKTLRQEGTGCA